MCVDEQHSSGVGVDVHSSTTCCLCNVPDPAVTRSDSTDRLVKTVLCYGRTWRRTLDVNVDVLVANGYALVDDERVRPTPVVHDLVHMWEQGSVPMVVVEADGAVLVSEPVVVHSWCMQSLFQVQVRSSLSRTSLTSMPASTQLVIAELDNPTKLVSIRAGALRVVRSCAPPPPQENLRGGGGGGGGGRKAPVATFETHTCVFCGKRTGWTTSCFVHLASERGCEVCTNAADASAAHAFHPSCAVFAGMQRVSRIEGYGMICSASAKWRDSLFGGLESFMGYMSGVNWFVTGEASSLVPEAGTALKGERFRKCVEDDGDDHCDVVAATHAAASTPRVEDSTEQLELRHALLSVLDDDATIDRVGTSVSCITEASRRLRASEQDYEGDDDRLRSALLIALDDDVGVDDLLPPKKRKRSV